MGILNILVAMQSQGVQVSGLVEACKQLADAQSRRSAVAAQILPVVHWVSLPPRCIALGKPPPPLYCTG